MDKEFLLKYGLNSDEADEILSKIGHSEQALTTKIRDLELKMATEGAGARDTELLKKLVSQEEDIPSAVEGLKKTSPWLFETPNAPIFSASCDCLSGESFSPFAHGAGITKF